MTPTLCIISLILLAALSYGLFYLITRLPEIE